MSRALTRAAAAAGGYSAEKSHFCDRLNLDTFSSLTPFPATVNRRRMPNNVSTALRRESPAGLDGE